MTRRSKWRNRPSSIWVGYFFYTRCNVEIQTSFSQGERGPMETKRQIRLLVGTSTLLLVILLLATAPTIHAKLAVTNVVYSWDYGTTNPGYQNSNVTIMANGGWQEFIHQFIGPNSAANEFDTDPVSTTVVASMDGATTSTYIISTTFGGLMDYAVNMTDTNGIGQGFQTTRRWSLVFCDRTREQKNDPPPPWGDLGNADLGLAPANQYYGGSVGALPLLIEELPTVFRNQIQPCTNGTCSYQLVTRLIVNLDKDGNGRIDNQYLIPAGQPDAGKPAALCFYAEAKRPTVANWAGNLQARISAGGGDKTVNFKTTLAPTAVTLSSFSARTSNSIEISDSTIVISIIALGFLALVIAFGTRQLQKHT